MFPSWDSLGPGPHPDRRYTATRDVSAQGRHRRCGATKGPASPPQPPHPLNRESTRRLTASSSPTAETLIRTLPKGAESKGGTGRGERRGPRPEEENRRHAVRAAILIDDLLKELRSGRSGRAVILEMLKDAAPGAVPAAELRFASGIQEFARRVRELREEGYDIRSTGDGYLLERVPDN